MIFVTRCEYHSKAEWLNSSKGLMFGSKEKDDKTDLCDTVCDENSACVLDNTTKKYECSCLAGYNQIGAKDASKTSHTHQ